MESERGPSSPYQGSLWPLALLSILGFVWFRSKVKALLSESADSVRACNSTNHGTDDSSNDSRRGIGITEANCPPTPTQCRYPEKKPKRWYKRWKPYVFVLNVATFIAVAWYACITRSEWKEMRTQTETAQKQFEAADRPWVAVDIALAAPLTYNESNGLSAVFYFLPKNIGRSPAQNIWVDPLLVPAFMGDDVSEAEKRACDKAVKHDELLRYFLIPGQSYRQQIGLGMSNAEVNSHWNKFELSRGPIDLIPIVLVGCVDYTYEASTRHHQTGFAYDVLTKDGLVIAKSKTPLPPDSISFRAHPTGRFFAN
ncbi:MAG: hypothetical protein LAO24_06560 [Acidobacteriia bacterium]|nr:hypothetical protein [Terriglobia bacterium]